jgi:hypothetical protein
VRGDRRRQIFLSVVPGLAAGKGRALDRLIDDTGAARQRLEEQLARLREQVAAS